MTPAHGGGPMPRRLALFGVPPALAEPVTLVAEILGWEVVQQPAGPAVRLQARLCMAMQPPTGGSPLPLAVWSPENNLNEHINRAGLAKMDQPLCITRVEQLLQALGCEP